MIISRTPMRISFVGGATDIKNFYSMYGGETVSCAINRYIYVTLNKRDDKLIIVSYNKMERVDSVDKIEHDIVREALKLAGIKEGVEIHIIGDISTIGTGLGGSSAVAVGLLKVLFPYKHNEEIAELSCHLEIDILKKDIGKQDQYACALGGIHQNIYNSDGTVISNFIANHDVIKNNMYLIPVSDNNHQREKAEIILARQNDNFISNIENLTLIKELCCHFINAINEADNVKIVQILNTYWKLKKQLHEGVTNLKIDNIINEYIKLGCGCKICGAGQSGFIFIYDYKNMVKSNAIQIQIDYSGTKLLSN